MRSCRNPRSKMANDLYTLLGVSRSASTKAIHAAYRRQSKGFHPDAGGSVEQFTRLRLARDVLTDPNRRARYDSTGAFDQTPADNKRAQLLGLLAQQLGSMLAETAKQGAQLTEVDLAAILRLRISNQMNTVQEKLKTLRSEAEQLRQLIPRWKAPRGEENVIASVIVGQLGQAEQQAKMMEAHVVMLAELLVLFDGYRFEHDPPRPRPMTGTTFRFV